MSVVSYVLAYTLATQAPALKLVEIERHNIIFAGEVENIGALERCQVYQKNLIEAIKNRPEEHPYYSDVRECRKL